MGIYVSIQHCACVLASNICDDITVQRKNNEYKSILQPVRSIIVHVGGTTLHTST